MLFSQSLFFKFLAAHAVVAKGFVVKTWLTLLFVWSGLWTVSPTTLAANWFTAVNHTVSPTWVFTVEWDANPTDPDFVEFTVMDTTTNTVFDSQFVPYSWGIVISQLDPGSYSASMQAINANQQPLGNPFDINDLFYFAYEIGTMGLLNESVVHGTNDVELISYQLTSLAESTLSDITIQLDWTATPATADFRDLINTIELFVEENGQMTSIGAMNGTQIPVNGTVVFSTFNYPLPAWEAKSFTLLVDTSANQSVSGTVQWSVTNFHFVADNGNFDENLTPNPSVTSNKTITVETPGDLNVSMNNDGQYAAEPQFIIAWEANVAIAQLDFTTAGSPVTVEDITISVAQWDFSGASDAIEELHLYDSNDTYITTEIFTDWSATFNNINISIDQQATYYVTMDTIQISNNVWVDTQYIQLQANIETDSNITVIYDQTWEQNTYPNEWFIIGWVGIESITSVSWANWQAAITEVNWFTVDNLIAIYLVQAKEWSTVNSTDGSNVSLLIEQLQIPAPESSLVIENVEVRIGNSPKTTIPFTDWILDLSSLPSSMREIESWESEYIFIYANITAWNGTIELSTDLININGGNNLNGWWILFTSTDEDTYTYDQLLFSTNTIEGNTITVIGESTEPDMAELTLQVAATQSECDSLDNYENCNHIENTNGTYTTTFINEASHTLIWADPLWQTLLFDGIGWLCLADVELNYASQSIEYTTDGTTFMPYQFNQSACTPWVQGLMVTVAVDENNPSELMTEITFESTTTPSTPYCINSEHNATNGEAVTLQLCTVSLCGNNIVEGIEQCDWWTSCTASCTLSDWNWPTDTEQEIQTYITTLEDTNNQVTNENGEQAFINALQNTQTAEDIAGLFEDSDDLVEFINDVDSTTSFADLQSNPTQFVANQRAEQLEEIIKDMTSTEDDEKAWVERISQLTSNGTTGKCNQPTWSTSFYWYR